jgi:hypothetical protein
MSDVIGMLAAPDGTSVTLVVSPANALNGNDVVGFPTLSDNIIVALNFDALNRSADHPEQPLNEVLEPFLGAIVEEAQRILDATPLHDPFDLQENDS